MYLIPLCKGCLLFVYLYLAENGGETAAVDGSRGVDAAAKNSYDVYTWYVIYMCSSVALV